MMEHPKPFSEEATKALDGYISDVTRHLSDTDLSSSEIEESIEELRNHIITHCEIKSKGTVITTDLVKEAIKKLGEPRIIAETLQGELDFAETVNETQTNSKIPKQTHQSSFAIKAKHISGLYAVMSWSITASLIFIISSDIFNYVSWYVPILYGSTLITLILTRNLDAYRFNQHLRRYVKPNFHTNISPLIYVLSSYSGLVNIPSWFYWTVPATIVMWLIISSTEYGRHYYLDTIQKIRETIEN